jgi:hypothetical protein
VDFSPAPTKSTVGSSPSFAAGASFAASGFATTGAAMPTSVCILFAVGVAVPFGGFAAGAVGLAGMGALGAAGAVIPGSAGAFGI